MCGCYINPALNRVQRVSIVPSKSQALQTCAHVATNSLYIPMKQTFLQLSLRVTVFSFLAFFSRNEPLSNLTSFALFSKQYLYQIISDSFVLAASSICSVDNLWPTGRVSHAAVEALHFYRHSRTQSACDLLKAGPLETVVVFIFWQFSWLKLWILVGLLAWQLHAEEFLTDGGQFCRSWSAKGRESTRRCQMPHSPP